GRRGGRPRGGGKRRPPRLGAPRPAVVAHRADTADVARFRHPPTTAAAAATGATPYFVSSARSRWRARWRRTRYVESESPSDSAGWGWPPGGSAGPHSGWSACGWFDAGSRTRGDIAAAIGARPGG